MQMGQENQKNVDRRSSGGRHQPHYPITGRASSNPLETSTSSAAAVAGRRHTAATPTKPTLVEQRRQLREQQLQQQQERERQRKQQQQQMQKRREEKAAAQKSNRATAKAKADKEDSDVELGDDDCDLQEVDEAVLRAQEAANAAAVEAQLAAVNKYLASTNNVHSDEEGDEGPNALPDFTVSARKLVQDSIVTDLDKSVGEVSLHSSDFANEELLQGLRDLDDELEEDYRKEVEDMQDKISDHKRNAVRLLKEEANKSAALRELQLAKVLEEKLTQLQMNHVPPVSVRMEAMEADITQLEDHVEEKKQQALAALRSGEKPTALELLKESKELAKQLDAMKAEYATLGAEKEALLHSAG